MYPYKINWATEKLKELHEYNSYGYTDDLLEIKKIIYKYIDEYIYEYKNEITNEITNCGTITLNRFYEMVNSDPYWDFIFLSVKYFDLSSKTWRDFEVNETELNDYLWSCFKIDKNTCEQSCSVVCRKCREEGRLSNKDPIKSNHNCWKYS